MKFESYLKSIVVALLWSLTTFQFASADEFIDLSAEGVSQADYDLQGEYRGADGEGVQIVARGGGKFLVQTYQGGLPGGGWDGNNVESVEDDTDGVNEYIEELELRKVKRRSSTLGAKPPTGAVVLFDGSAESLSDHWKDGAKKTEDGLLKQGATSKDTFRDYTLHLEFRLPFEPTKRGQGRANSGVYHQGRYETQVLDSFGLEGKHNECGGIYSVQKPSVNMCLPPGTWQTYDVEFTAARWSGSEKVRDARMTVKMNGVAIHRNVEVPKTTTAAPLGESNEPGPIYIQDHGNEIRFRNIWVLPRDGDREETRPRIAGFERFHASSSSGDAVAGELLIGELGCKSCHKISEELDNRTWHKMAPILDNVGSRLKSGWIARFVADPHGTKPGTTMPNLFTGWSDEQKESAAVALASYLVHDQRDEQPKTAGGSGELGFQLFNSVGCLACHDSRASKDKKLATSVPLLDLGEKYHPRGLRDFLRDPVSVRPSGRMPSCGLNQNEAASVARYLTQSTEPTMRFAAYEGSWDKLPDFDSLNPYLEGECYGFSVKVAARGDNFGLRFLSNIQVPADGSYRFTTKSDDGSRLYIDGKLVVDNDDVHGVREKDGKVDLTKGMHELRVEFFEKGGGEELTCTIEGPDLPREDLAGWLTLEADTAETESDEATPADVYRADLVEEGKRLFTTMGCASCHQKTSGGQAVASRLSTPSINNLGGGCMAAAAPDGAGPNRTIPDFYLSTQQLTSLKAALANPGPRDRTPQDLLQHQMTSLNCYACHERDGVGGPEEDRNKSFKTTQREMGDEARVPPPLNGVGDKLREDWIKRVLERGDKARPYMLTRMPKFGEKNIAGLVDAFVSMDRKETGAAKLATVDMPGHKLKATGRKLVGDKAFACVKCHVFGKTPATGVQAVDLQTMTKRIREDWFHRYLQDPNAYRPGTRMPSGFVDGKSVAPKILDGDPPNQLAAMWAYLGQGTKAGKPSGIGGRQIELVPLEFPIIYRNFIQGLSARGIAVGYPESLNLAWDAEAMCVKRIWTGQFIDAAKHWIGRGPGFQEPLGDQVAKLEDSAPVAILSTADADWPQQPARKRGYRFKGYRLNELRQPEFRYEFDGIEVRDLLQPVTNQDGMAQFTRRITITAKENGDSPIENVYFQAAAGGNIKAVEDWFVVDGEMKIRVRLPVGSDSPRVQSINGTRILVLIKLGKEPVVIQQDIAW